MKKLIIWFLAIVLFIVGITATAITSLAIDSIVEIPIDKLPADVQLKDIVTDYPIKIGTESDKAVLRITKKAIIYKNKDDGFPSINSIEIIVNDQSIYKEKLAHSLFYNKNYDYYTLGHLTLYDYRIIKGADKDYLTYNISNDEDGGYYEYTLIDIRRNHGKFEAIKVKENLLVSNTDKPFANSKLDDHTYKLMEDKYIISPIGLTFKAKAYYEVVDNKVQLADREFELSDVTTNKEKLQKSPVVTIYNKPSTQSASTSMKLSENIQIKFIGIRYMGINEASEYIIHAIIDGKEGWMTGSDFREID